MSNQYKILLIEDEPVVVDSAARILGSEGLQVEHVTDGRTAIVKLQKATYQLIICDLMLPDLLGIELLKEIKKINIDIPFIIVTGYANLENAINSFKFGAFDFLPKPFDFEELIAVVSRAIAYKKLSSNSKRADKRIVRITRKRIKDSEKRKYYFLGEHSWAKIENEGTVSIGVAETFVSTMGEITNIELPFSNSEVWQGNLCVRIVAKNHLTHIVWAPLSGQVIRVNAAVEEDPNLIYISPFDKGWLFEIIPINLANELENLTGFNG